MDARPGSTEYVLILTEARHRGRYWEYIKKINSMFIRGVLHSLLRVLCHPPLLPVAPIPFDMPKGPTWPNRGETRKKVKPRFCVAIFPNYHLVKLYTIRSDLNKSLYIISQSIYIILPRHRICIRGICIWDRKYPEMSLFFMCFFSCSPSNT